MSYFVLLVALGAALSGSPTKNRSRDESEARRLVDQLGADSFAAREAASKDLTAMGEQALSALRSAVKSTDPEVRWRASKLVRAIEGEARRRQLEDIKKSKLPPREKGRKLKTFINKGMTRQAAEAILGPGDILFDLDVQEGNIDNLTVIYFKNYALTIDFVKLLSDVSRVNEIRVREK
jgi:hypothetical protein